MTMYALTWYHDEERSHDGVWLVAVSEDTAKLEEKAVELESEKLAENMEQEPLPGQEPVAELAWADWGSPHATESVAVVDWGRYSITEVDVIPA
jgi:hypothetical protein